MSIRRVSAAFTTTAGGDATVYTTAVNGFIDNVFYDYLDAATGADLTVTEESTGRALLTITDAAVADLTWRPRVGGHPIVNTAGGTIIPGGATTGGNGNADLKLPVVGRIKVVVAQGGNAKTGVLYFDIVKA